MVPPTNTGVDERPLEATVGSYGQFANTVTCTEPKSTAVSTEAEKIDCQAVDFRERGACISSWYTN